MTSRAMMPDHTVVIDGTTIRTVAPSHEVDTSAMQVVDAPGQWVMPGLADMHVHYDDPRDFAMFLANGVTFVRNMWGAPMHLALQRKLQNATLPGPHLMTTTPLIDGADEAGHTLWPGSVLLDDPSEAPSLVRRLIERGYQQLKVYSWLGHDELAALGAAAAEVGVTVTGHCPDGISFEEAVESGMTCFEHLTNVARGHLKGGVDLPSTRNRSPAARIEALRLTNEHMDWDAIRRLASDLAHQQIWNCPTLVLWQQMAVDESTGMADPLLRYEHPATIALWRPQNDPRLRVGKRAPDYAALMRARVEILARVVSILHEEGAPLLIGTDTPNPFVFQGFSVQRELSSFVDAGLSPYEALRCATADAAAFAGQQDSWGTVVAGKRADLLVLRSNPLENVAAVREIEAVFVNGRYLSRKDLDHLLEDRERDVRDTQRRLGDDAWLIARDERVGEPHRLLECLAGCAVGRVEYSIEEASSNEWMIREVYRNDVTDETRRSSVWLDDACVLVAAACELESSAGTATSTVALERGSAYVVTARDVDDFHTVARFPATTPLVPSESFSIVGLAFAVARLTTESCALLELRHGEARILSARISTDRDATTQDAAAMRRRIAVDLPGERREQTYGYDDNGTLTNIIEKTWRGLREVVSIEMSTRLG